MFIVIDFNFSNSAKNRLPQQKRRFLILNNRSLYIGKFQTTEIHLAKIDYSANIDITNSITIVCISL